MAIIEANKKKVVGESLTLSKNLNVPTRYLDDQKQKNDEAIGKTKRKRSGKKSIITMKISQMNKLIEEHDSRTKLKFFHGNLLESQNEITDLDEQLMEELASTMTGLQK